MKLIIDIPENIIEEAKSSPNYYPFCHYEKIWRAIANGTPYEERPTGEWIATQVIGISEITLTCSNCEDKFIGENDIDTWKSVYHYCPSCGAYMG